MKKVEIHDVQGCRITMKGLSKLKRLLIERHGFTPSNACIQHALVSSGFQKATERQLQKLKEEGVKV